MALGATGAGPASTAPCFTHGLPLALALGDPSLGDDLRRAVGAYRVALADTQNLAAVSAG